MCLEAQKSDEQVEWFDLNDRSHDSTHLEVIQYSPGGNCSDLELPVVKT